MRLLHRLAGGFKALFRRRHVEAELDAELREFLQASIDAKIAAGLSPNDAVRAARLELGSPAAVKDWVRDVGWETRVESVWQDARYAGRVLRRSPGFALATIGTLAIGLGATAAMYAIVDAVLLKPLPYAEPERVVEVRLRDIDNGNYGLSAGAIQAVRGLPAVEYVAGSVSTERALVTADVSLLVTGEAVTEEFFQVFGVPAAIGRTFSAADRDAGPVVVLSDRFWRRVFAARREIVGDSATLSGVPHQVLGVMPADFRVELGLRDDVDYWVHRPFSPSEVAESGPGPYHTVSRIRTSDLRVPRAQLAGLNLPGARTEQGEPLMLAFVPALDAATMFYGDVLWSLLGAVSLVLLLACGNVANLLLARGRQRTAELVIREAIGASRGRIARQMLVECAVLAGAAAVVGAGLAWLLVEAVPLLPARTMNIARIDEVALNGRVFTFLLAITATTILTFGLLPTIAAAHRGGAAGPVRSVTRRQGRAPQALIAIETAATVALLVGSGLVAVRIADLMTTDFGFDAGRIQIASMRPTGPEHRGPALGRFYQAVIDRLRDRTGMQAVLIDRVPLDYWRAPAVRVQPAFRDAAGMRAGIRVMSAGALTYIGADLIAGREFREDDREGATRTAVVNESLAARLSAAGGSPIGTRLTVTWQDEPHELQVVGVVRDLRDSVYRPAGPEVYVSAAQFPQTRATFVIRGERSPDEVAATLRQALREVDPRQALSDVVAVSDRVRTYTALSRFVGILLIVFAALAVLLAATGVLAVLAGAVASRTREIGIRIAVGATRLDVVSCLSREFIPALAAGAVAGAVASYSLSSVLRSLVPGVSPVHPAAYGMAIAGVVAIAVAGAWWPVRRALGIDPALVLNSPEEW